MRRFALLFEELDTTQSTALKVAAMQRYFHSAPPADAAWATYVLCGRRQKRLIGRARLLEWLVEATALPQWLIEETYASVGDLAETVALLVARDEAPAGQRMTLDEWFREQLVPLRDADPASQREQVLQWWRGLSYRECLVACKLLTGSLRIGVSKALVVRALAEATGVERAVLTRRLMGEFTPDEAFWAILVAPADAAEDRDRPYPFLLAAPLAAQPEALGARSLFLAEWKWDGIRAQLVRRGTQVQLWSRGEDIVTDRFPEIAEAGGYLADGIVLDGEILAGTLQEVMPFAALQKRLGRQRVSPALRREIPVCFVAYDLLELGGNDLRNQPLHARRAQLELLLPDANARLACSPILDAPDWGSLRQQRDAARARRVEGLMLKRLDAPYGIGRRIGHWWKWKLEPRSFDGVLLYAQPGHGRRANLYTDYTFGVWDGSSLVTIAKAYSGLSNAEITRLDRWIRGHTLQKHGPVRAVAATQVFEIAYEALAASPRHKSGVALRFPRILRWREDKPAAEADRLESLRALLEAGDP